MKTMKILLLAGVGLLGSTALLAQTDNKYLDDAYYRRSDLKKIDQEARRQAELRRAAERAEREAWEKEQAELIANYKKKQADLELDAYNGRLSTPEDTIQLTRSELGRLLKEQRTKGRDDVYGQYSSRLNRFYGDGRLVLGGASRIYIDADPWYSDVDYSYSGSDVYVRVGSRDSFWGPRWGWSAGWGWGSWYDPYYSSAWGYYPGYWGARYYDPFYYGRYYGGYYGGYWGAGYYDPYYSGYWGARYPYSYSYYPRYYSGYSGYRAVRRNEMTITPSRPLGNGASTSRSYDRSDSYSNSWNQQRSTRSYEQVPQRSYDRSATETNNGSSNSGGGYRTPARRR